MNTIRRTPEFIEWLANLKDPVAKAQIAMRLKRAAAGNFGDIAPVGNGVSEMRVHVGPGYRVYYIQQGRTVYILMNGGDKSTQKRDIARAIELAKVWRS